MIIFFLLVGCLASIIFLLLLQDDFKEYRLFIRRLIISLDDRGYAPKTIWNILTVYDSDFWELKPQETSEDIELILPP